MRMMRLFAKLVGKALLLPVLLVLMFCYGVVDVMVNLYSVAKWLVEILFGIILIGTIVWYRNQIMNYAILAIAEGMIFVVLVSGVFVQALLKVAMCHVSNIIMGGI